MSDARVILGIVIGSLLTSLPYALWVTEPAFSDMRSYEAIAENLLTRGEYVFDGEWRGYRTPGLVLYLAGIYSVAGFKNYLAVRLLQCGMFALMNVLLFRIGSEIFGRRVALWGVALTILSHEMVFWVAKPATEFPYTFLLVSFTSLIVTGSDRSARARMAGAAVVIGIATLTRPEAAPIAAVTALGLMITRPPGTPWKTRIATGALFSVVFALTLCPWVIRNWMTFDRLIVSTQSGHTLYTSNEALAGPEKSYDEIEQPLYDRIRESWQPGDAPLEVQANDYFEDEARRAIRERPLDFLRLVAGRLRVMLTERHVYLTQVPWDSLRYFGRFDIQLIYWNPILLVAAILGVFAGLLRKLRGNWLLFSIIVLTAAIHSIYLGLPRNRLPLRPFLNLYACYGLAIVGAWLRVRIARVRSAKSPTTAS